MAQRKTLDIAKFTAQINQVLADSTCSADHRRGLMAALETVLHDTGNYRGFRYLTHTEVPVGHKPGINVSPLDGQHLKELDACFADTDNTRVGYYIG